MSHRSRALSLLLGASLLGVGVWLCFKGAFESKGARESDAFVEEREGSSDSVERSPDSVAANGPQRRELPEGPKDRARPDNEAPDEGPRRVLPRPEAPSSDTRPADEGGPLAVGAAEEGFKLDVNSEDFDERVDDRIPARLYGLAAECYRGDRAGKNEKVRLSFRARITEGLFSVTEASVLETSVPDPTVAECMRGALLEARWEESDMPDWEGEDELLIRARGIKKHARKADEDS